MQQEICDLHIHSNFSDGSSTVQEIIDIAIKSNIKAVSLCDHNTVEGLPLFIKTAEEKNITAVAGVEVSCEYNAKEIHILGLFIPQENFERLSKFLSEINLQKSKSNKKLTENLNIAGYRISFDDVKNIAGCAIPNRVHFARELINKGYVKSVEEAFETILSEKRGLYVPAEKKDAIEVIKYLSSLSVVPILAHPFLNLNAEELESFLSQACKFGLVGMECIYTKFTDKQTAQAFEIANRFGLLPSGGSDFHGKNKPNTKMGFGNDNILIPFKIYEDLKTFKDNINK